jgi:hypothetical protein
MSAAKTILDFRTETAWRKAHGSQNVLVELRHSYKSLAAQTDKIVRLGLNRLASLLM